MMRSKPLVSVIIPTFNRAAYLLTAIESIRQQTLSDIEIIVVDDGSTDETPELLAQISDRRVRVVRCATNQGIAHARNTGLDLAEGRYVAVLDSDDFAFRNRLERQVNFLDTRPEYAAAGTWGAWMDSEGNLFSKIKQQPVSDGEIRTRFLFTCCVNNRSVMGRTDIFQAYRYPEDLRVASDYEFHGRIMQKHKFANLPEVLVVGRYHENQITTSASNDPAAVKRGIVERLLNDIGISPTARELDRHIALWRSHDTNEVIDADFLEWARDWMARLKVAIPAEPQEIDRVLGRLWIKVAGIALRHTPTRTTRVLTGGGWPLLMQGARQHLDRAVTARRHRARLPERIPMHHDPKNAAGTESLANADASAQ